MNISAGSNNVLTCMEDGMWSFPEALCELRCPIPPPVPNAVLQTKRCNATDLKVGSFCKYKCKPGYHAPHVDKFNRWETPELTFHLQYFFTIWSFCKGWPNGPCYKTWKIVCSHYWTFLNFLIQKIWKRMLLNDLCVSQDGSRHISQTCV